MTPAREARLAEVVCAVARQALADRGVQRVALVDDGSPEAALAARLLAPLGEGVVARVRAEGAGVEPLLQTLAPIHGAERAAREVAGLRARLEPGALPAAPENKTALLLGGPLPAEPFLPLGDLWAGEVAELAGGWSAPAEVRSLAEAAGGIGALDAALRGVVERRDPAALGALPEAAREEALRLLARGRAGRLFPVLVPKLGHRTLGVDLFE